MLCIALPTNFGSNQYPKASRFSISVRTERAVTPRTLSPGQLPKAQPYERSIAKEVMTTLRYSLGVSGGEIGSARLGCDYFTSGADADSAPRRRLF